MLAQTAVHEGTWGYYFSSKGYDSPKHGKPCKVISSSGEDIRVEFKDKRLGRDSVHMGKFEVDPEAEFA